MYVNPTWELKYLGEDPGGILVETPDGEQGMLPGDLLENYARVDNKLIPKNSIDWL
jgi:hypothetical protein